jgi:hypothetical protein
MALTNQEKTQILTLLNREGGLYNFITEVQSAFIANQQSSAASTLGSAITVTVQDWPTLQTFLTSTTQSAAILQIMAALNTAAAGQNAANLGPLLWALYGLAKVHFGV